MLDEQHDRWIILAVVWIINPVFSVYLLEDNKQNAGGNVDMERLILTFTEPNTHIVPLCCNDMSLI